MNGSGVDVKLAGEYNAAPMLAIISAPCLPLAVPVPVNHVVNRGVQIVKF